MNGPNRQLCNFRLRPRRVPCQIHITDPQSKRRDQESMPSANRRHLVFLFRFPRIIARVFLLPFPIGSIHPLNESSTRTSFSEPRALSLLTLPHLNLVRFPLQILLVPALHPIHLRSPALRRAWQDLALAVSSAVGDADGLGLGLGVSLRIGVVMCGRVEGNAGLGG
jgi:hypothetical protein